MTQHQCCGKGEHKLLMENRRGMTSYLGVSGAQGGPLGVIALSSILKNE